MNVMLSAYGPRKSGKSAIIAICRKALLAEGFSITKEAADSGQEYILVEKKDLPWETELEWHRKEIARICAEHGVI